MLAQLTTDFRIAAAAAPFPVAPTAAVVWGFSLREILAKVGEKALELGREYRDEIESAAKAAIDALVSLDLPGIPGSIEDAIDGATRELGYRAIAAVLDAILAEPITG